MNGDSLRYHALNAEIEEYKKWHQCFGHYNDKDLKVLHFSNMVEDFTSFDYIDEICEICQQGKMHMLPFPKGSGLRAKEKLELVHTDVCGPMRTTSFGNNKYFILFINDFTRMTWIYFLSEKTQVFDIFKKFVNLVETQSRCKLKILRSDNGKEYTSKQFDKFCEDFGIQHQLSIAYTL